MIIETFKRYERKYFVTAEQYHILLGLLEPYTQKDPYCLDGKSYPLYNVYFDTPDNRIIRDSLLKPYYKAKLRLRSYYPNPDADTRVFLELKKKFGVLTNKRRAVITYSEALRFINGERIGGDDDNYMKNQVLNEIYSFLEYYPDARPAMNISYDRVALFGKENKEFRITFDKNILARSNNVGFNINGIDHNLIDNGMYLMEIKITDAIPIWFTSALSELGIYSTSFSKYRNAYIKFYISGKSPAPEAEDFKDLKLDAVGYR